MIESNGAPDSGSIPIVRVENKIEGTVVPVWLAAVVLLIAGLGMLAMLFNARDLDRVEAQVRPLTALAIGKRLPDVEVEAAACHRKVEALLRWNVDVSARLQTRGLNLPPLPDLEEEDDAAEE